MSEEFIPREEESLFPEKFELRDSAKREEMARRAADSLASLYKALGVPEEDLPRIRKELTATGENKNPFCPRTRKAIGWTIYVANLTEKYKEEILKKRRAKVI